MAEVLRQNIQDVYKKWESRSNPQVRPRSSYGQRIGSFEPRKQKPNLARSTSDNSFTHFERRKRNRYPATKLPKYHGIFQFKMAPSVLPASKERPYLGLCCMKCLPRSRASLPNSYVQSFCICNIFHVPFTGMSTRFMPQSLQLLYFMFSRSAKFNYPDVSAQVLHCKKLNSTITNIVECSDLGIASSTVTRGEQDDSIEVLLSKQKSKAQEMICDIKVSMNQLLLRFSSLFLYKTLSFMVQSIQVHKGQIETLKSSCEEDCPIIYVPVYQSHLDCILVSLILYMNNLKVPVLAIGNIAIIPFFEKILQYLGVLFVKSKYDSNLGQNKVLYQAVVQSYVIQSLKACHSLELFIEGSHSHALKPCSAQFGLLSSIIDSVLKEDIDDVYLVPVSVSYEKAIDDNFIFHQLGKRKSSENFLSSIFSAWKLLHSNFGNIRVNFCQPFSLKEYLQSNNQLSAESIRKSSTLETPPSSPSSTCSSCHSSSNNISSHGGLKVVVKNLTDHIIYGVTHSTALMSTHLIAFLFLMKHRQGATQPQLLCSFNWLKGELTKRKYDVAFTGDLNAVIKHGISLLGKELIDTEIIELEWTSSDMENNNVKVQFHKPIIKLPYVLELQYYANVAVPVFFLDSVVVNALYAVIDDDICHFQLCDSKLFVRKDELVEKAIDLCNILRYEHLPIPPCGDLVSAINEVIYELMAKECLLVLGVGKYSSGHGGKAGSRRAQHLSFEASDEDEDVPSYSACDQRLKVDLSEESIDYLKFLRNVLSPCIESYWLSACTLLKVVHEVIEEKEFLREIQRTAEDRLHKGLLGYEESFGAETLKNSLKLFEYLQVVDHCYEDGLKFYYLCESYDSEEKVSDIISRIEIFRQ